MSNRDAQSIAAEATLNFEVRFAGNPEDGVLQGRAVAFDVVDAYRTSFDRNAFELDGKRVPLLWGHDANQVIGSVRTVSADQAGLNIEAKLNLAVPKAQEARALLQAGDISGLSVGFRRLADEPRANGVRHITKASLREVSVTPFPAVPGSNVQAVRTSSGLAGFIEAAKAATQTLKGDSK